MTHPPLTISKGETVRRYAVLSVALFLSALGIATIANSNLGTTPITSLPFALHMVFPISLGVFVFLSNIVFFAMQKALLHFKLQPRHLILLPVVFVFSAFVDLGMALTRPLISTQYLVQVLLCVSGNALLGLGISIAIVCNVTVLPGDGVVMAIAHVSQKIFGNIKILFDLSLVGIACLVSFLCLGEIVGLREGTLLSAFLVGPFVRLFSRWSCKLEAVFNDKTRP